jgi:hypothetical protein
MTIVADSTFRCSGLATFAYLPQALRNLKIGVLQARRTRRSSRFGQARAPHPNPRGLGIGVACRSGLRLRSVGHGLARQREGPRPGRDY